MFTIRRAEIQGPFDMLPNEYLDDLYQLVYIWGRGSFVPHFWVEMEYF